MRVMAKIEAANFGGFEVKRTACIVFDLRDLSRSRSRSFGNEHRCGHHPDHERRRLAEGATPTTRRRGSASSADEQVSLDAEGATEGVPETNGGIVIP